MKKVLILGASSYVGARIFFDLRKDFEVFGTFYNNPLFKDFIKLDITNKEEVKRIFEQYRPDVVVHVANNASGSWCKKNPKKAVELNQGATEHIVAAANQINAKVIYISSFAAIKPVDLYGKTKAASEKIVKKTKKGYLILRPSLIMGFSPNTTNDRPFNRLLRNLEGKTEAIYDTSWKFQPTYIGHISEVIKTCIKNNIWGEIIPIVIKEVKTRFDVGKDILKPFKIKVIPKDEQIDSPLFKGGLKRIKELGLSFFDYDSMIKTIVGEIKERKKFRL